MSLILIRVRMLLQGKSSDCGREGGFAGVELGNVSFLMLF